jgi:hypothetical protein
LFEDFKKNFYSCGVYRYKSEQNFNTLFFNRLIREEKIAPGDLSLELVLINPDFAIPQIEQIAKVLNEGYSSSPRAKFPKVFVKK